MFQATLFDFNGVLVDDEVVHLQAFRDAVQPLGLTISDKEYWDEYLGYDDVGAFAAILKKAGMDHSRPRIDELVEAKRPLYMDRARKSLKTFEGAADLIKRRAAQGPVAIVSGALTQEIEFGLQHLGVSDLVGKIISAEDTTVSKPDAEGYRMGIEWLSTQTSSEIAQRALVVEDSLDGIVAAKAVSLPTVAVAHSYSRPELENSAADLVLDHVRELSDERLSALYRKLYG